MAASYRLDPDKWEEDYLDPPRNLIVSGKRKRGDRAQSEPCERLTRSKKVKFLLPE